MRSPRRPSCRGAASGTLAGPLATEPMTTIGPDGSRYFSDPYAIRPVPALRRREVAFPRHHQGDPELRRADRRRPLHGDADDQVSNFQNLDLFQDDGGAWPAMLAIGVRNPSHPGRWTVPAHAHPGRRHPARLVRRRRALGIVLRAVRRHLRRQAAGGGRAALPALHEDPCARARPARRRRPAADAVADPAGAGRRRADPVTPPAPGGRFGPLASERYDHTPARLVEAPAIARIGGR